MLRFWAPVAAHADSSSSDSDSDDTGSVLVYNSYHYHLLKELGYSGNIYVDNAGLTFCDARAPQDIPAALGTTDLTNVWARPIHTPWPSILQQRPDFVYNPMYPIIPDHVAFALGGINNIPQTSDSLSSALQTIANHVGLGCEFHPHHIYEQNQKFNDLKRTLERCHLDGIIDKKAVVQRSISYAGETPGGDAIGLFIKNTILNYDFGFGDGVNAAPVGGPLAVILAELPEGITDLTVFPRYDHLNGNKRLFFNNAELKQIQDALIAKNPNANMIIFGDKTLSPLGSGTVQHPLLAHTFAFDAVVAATEIYHRTLGQCFTPAPSADPAAYTYVRLNYTETQKQYVCPTPAL